jgi:hypothetical protein
MTVYLTQIGHVITILRSRIIVKTGALSGHVRPGWLIVRPARLAVRSGRLDVPESRLWPNAV